MFRSNIAITTVFLGFLLYFFLTENRICFNNARHVYNNTEDEKHVLLYWPVYEDIRQYLLNHACLYNNNVVHLINIYFYLIILKYIKY